MFMMRARHTKRVLSEVMYQTLYISKTGVKVIANSFPEMEQSPLMKTWVGIDYATKQK